MLSKFAFAAVCIAAVISCIWFMKPQRPTNIVFENEQLIVYSEYDPLTNMHEIKTVNK